MSPVLAETVVSEQTKAALQKPITLDQALSIAFAESPSIRIALDQIEKSKFGISEARGNFMPNFKLDVTRTYQGPAVTITLPESDISANIVQPRSTAAAANVVLPLDINRRLTYVSDLAKMQFAIDYLSLTATSQKLIYDVKSAYYGVLRAKGQQETAQSSVDVAMAQLKDAGSRFSAGTAPKFDVTRAQVNVANLNQTLVQAKSRVAIAVAVLNQTMGVDVSAPTELVKNEISVAKDPVDIAKAIDQAYANRPEVKSAQAAVEMNEKNARIQRTSVLPSLGLSGTFNYSFNPGGFSSASESWIALADLKIPIWDGGVAKAKVAEAYADMKKAKDTVVQVRQGVALETRTAGLNLHQATERVATAAESVSLAEEALRLANVRYSEGISVMVEVLDAQSALTLARVNFVDAQYDYATSVAQLQKATGSQPELEKLQLLKPADGGRG